MYFIPSILMDFIKMKHNIDMIEVYLFNIRLNRKVFGLIDFQLQNIIDKCFKMKVDIRYFK